ncbi:SIR2 family protein [Agrococcus sp. Marseille-P2731]|uniref:SIR2 family protein n=1 Tax=Agrococcus sp. Marseille-P2731 TaxID=1841862 RepID=UPI000930EF05|nr:SIR2 family protein [Agrococcus sp. Marseille-P2731]
MTARERARVIARERALLVVGYSMRDEHINVAITRWLNEREEREITIVDPGFSDGEKGSFPYRLKNAAVKWIYEDQREDRLIALRVRREYARDALLKRGFWEGDLYPQSPQYGRPR